MNMNEAKHLHDKIVRAGLPVSRVGYTGGMFSLDFPPDATQAQRDQAEAIRLGFDPAAAKQLARRAAAKGLLDDHGPEGILRRAMARAFGSQFNPPKTLEQLRAIIDPDIDSGNCD